MGTSIIDRNTNDFKGHSSNYDSLFPTWNVIYWGIVYYYFILFLQLLIFNLKVCC